MDELEKGCQTLVQRLEPRGANMTFQEASGLEKEKTRQLTAAVKKEERLETGVQNEAADTVSGRVYKVWGVNDGMEYEMDQLIADSDEMNSSDDGSNESGSDDEYDSSEEREITEHASWYCTEGRELTESNLNPYCDSLLRAEERSEESVAAASSGSYETTICDGGAASSTTAPSGSTDGQSEKCPICLCDFVTQEVATPDACNHSFCVDCLQEWLKNTNTCPVDRQVCDNILVRRCQGREIVKRIHVEPPMKKDKPEEVIDHVIRCEECNLNSDLALIYCDRCGRGYHLECVFPSLDTVPEEEWTCSDCSDFAFLRWL
jgi:PHD and RING finger domain-containing protein 1